VQKWSAQTIWEKSPIEGRGNEFGVKSDQKTDGKIPAVGGERSKKRTIVGRRGS